MGGTGKPIARRTDVSGQVPLLDASRIPAAASVRAGDDLEKMPIRIFEIDAAPTVVIIRLAGPPLRGVSPEGKPPVANSSEYSFEFSVVNKEGVVLAHYFTVDVHVVEIGIVFGRDHMERSPFPRGRKAEHLGQEHCRRFAVAGRKNRVIEPDGHVDLPANGTHEAWLELMDLCKRQNRCPARSVNPAPHKPVLQAKACRPKVCSGF